jgi:hypothetical protein
VPITIRVAEPPLMTKKSGLATPMGNGPMRKQTTCFFISKNVFKAIAYKTAIVAPDNPRKKKETKKDIDNSTEKNSGVRSEKD